MNEIAPTVAVEIDRVFVIIRRRELQRAEFAGPVPDHLARPQVAALDDAQRIDQLGAEELRSPAIIGERRDRAQDRIFAVVAAEIALERPEGGDHRRRHAVLLLDTAKQIGMALDHCDAALDAIARRHAVGELQEALLEHALPVIAPHDRRVEGNTVERR